MRTVSYVAGMDEKNGFLAADRDVSVGSELAAAYQAASPFPHVIIDDFLPAALLDRFLERFAAGIKGRDEMMFDRPQERLKLSYQPDSLDTELRQLFYSFNSRPFIKIIENVSGIKGLIPDPYFLGAGIHELKEGGHLSIHSDFNHHKIMNLERRINVLIYLNKDWQPQYGGNLELWDQGMTVCEQRIVPLFNRCVIFNTTSNSQHGNPQPVYHPDGISRKSIALYYYTATWDSSKRAHTTQFQVRPGSTDRFDWRVKIREMKDEFLPPIIARKIRV